jgi:hypothetical protein
VPARWPTRRVTGPSASTAEDRSLTNASREDRTGWSIRKFVRTARRYRIVQIRAGQHILTAEDPLPADLREILALVR